MHRKSCKVMKNNSLGSTSEVALQGCGRNCVNCKLMEEGNVRDHNGMNVRTDRSITCRTSNVVYGLVCRKCKHLVYVGETSKMLKERIQGHLHLIRSEDKFNAVPIHFNTDGHNVDDLKVIGIEKINRSGTIYRREQEGFYMKKYGTLDKLNKKE